MLTTAMDKNRNKKIVEFTLRNNEGLAVTL